MERREGGDGGEELARAIFARDRQAERELVERFRRGVRVILRRAGARPEALDDLEQETFQLALVRLREGALRDPARLAGFVAGVARNVGLGSRRDRLRHPSAGPDPEEAAAAEQPAESGPLTVLLGREQASLVRAVLDELGGQRDREVLRRTYLLGEPKDRICAELGLEPRQLDHVLSRARARYRALYRRRSGG